jgi:hypothetical protein
MADRQVFHSTKGAEIQTIWYIEPPNAAPAFFSALLGKVAADGIRRIPAYDHEYKYCYCDEASQTQFDINQISYAEHIPYDTDGGVTEIRNAIQKSTPFDANKDTKYIIMPEKNKGQAAGVFIKAIYRPLITAYTYPSTEANNYVGFDYLNPLWTAKHKTHLINAGLRIRTPPFLGMFSYYPAAGIAPTLEEQYRELQIERKMLRTTIPLSVLDAAVNNVNGQPMQGGAAAAGHITWSEFPEQTMKFTGYDIEVVYVPDVNDTGEPNGTTSWLNLKLYFDCRFISSSYAYDWDGARCGEGTRINWNQMLVYPGLFRDIKDGTQLGWYHMGYRCALGAFNPANEPYIVKPNLGDVFDQH